VEITQYYPAQLARVRIQVFDDKMIVQCKSLFRETVEEVNYRDINPDGMRERSGDPGWTSIGWFFIVLAALVGWLWMFGAISELLCLMLAVPLFVFAAVSFVLRAVVKYDHVVFRRKTGQLVLPFKLGARNRQGSQIVLESLIARIERANAPDGPGTP
jgi:hypothetical protein